MVSKLAVPVLCNAVLAVILYLMEKKTPFGKVNYKLKQIIIGVLFGALAAFSTEYGIDVNGAVMNVRDASPLCAGLIFGAPAGIIAGLIGGIYRYIAVLWGAGTYTRLACSISTVLAGVIAAALRKFMFDDKKPSWIYGIGVGLICEVLHMLMIFFTNMNDANKAFMFVQKCTLPMILANSIAVAAAMLVISLIGKEKIRLKNEKKQISQTFQFWLFVCIVIAYAATSLFTYSLQTGMTSRETEILLNTNISDVERDIREASDKNLLEITRAAASEYKNGASLESLCDKYDVSGINIIGKNGVITKSTLPEFVGYDMSSGKQSKEFLTLLNDKDEFVQGYQPLSIDESITRKYAGVKLSDGGFIQVGYNAERFQKDIDAHIIGYTKNRHIGHNGFIIICKENGSIVSDKAEYANKTIDNFGISLSADEGAIFETKADDTLYYASYAAVEGYRIISMIPKADALYMRNVSLYVSIFMEILIFAALFILIYFLIKKIIIDNLRKINTTLSEITDGNLNVTVNVRSNEEFASLSDDINQTVSTLKRYIADAAARIDKELKFAKQIQYSALPAVFPPFPNRNDFEIYAKMVTAKEVGGDFYDFYMLGESTLAFMIADVSGKGIGAAMFMMRAKTTIKDLAESGLAPDEIFTLANKRLCENNDAGMFVTAWLGILDLKTGALKFVNAGHNPPLVRHEDGGFEYLKARGGMVLAGMDGVKYKTNELCLSPGDTIFLYTDGVTEATNDKNELYGEERLLSLANKNITKTPQQLIAAVKDDVDVFVGDAPQFDDITMLAVSVNYVKGDEKIKVIPNEKSFAAVQSFAEDLTKKLAVVPKVSNKVNIAFDEIYSNIVNYSNADMATISYEIKDGRLYMTFTDDGIPYNPIKAEEPDVTLSAEERKIGGLGIFMVKKMTESMEYKYENERNILSIVISLG